MDGHEFTNLIKTSELLTYVAYLFIFNMLIILIGIILGFNTPKNRICKNTGANIVIFFVGQLLQKTWFMSITVICLLPFYHTAPFEIQMNIWTWGIALLVADFTYYWMHRLEHKYRILWAYHSLHHYFENYNFPVTIRLNIVESAIKWIFLVPMALIGFNPFQTIICFVFVAQYQMWIHTEKIVKLRWLNKVFNNPSVYRVNLGSNAKYLDKNYGGIFIIWDKLFGTFQKEEEKVVCGLTKNIYINNSMSINFIEYNNILSDLKKCRTWNDRFKVIFGNKNWHTVYQEEIKLNNTDKARMWTNITYRLNKHR